MAFCRIHADKQQRKALGMKKAGFYAVFVVLIMLVTSHADTIILNSGKSVKGEIVEETPDEVVVRQSSGVTTRISRDDIEEIVRTEDLLKECEKRLGKIERGDTQAMMNLATWCAEHGLKEQQRKLLEQILETEPENAEARRMLDILEGRLPESAREEKKESDGITFAPGNGKDGKEDGLTAPKKQRKIWKDSPKKETGKKNISKIMPPLGTSSKGTGGACPVNGTTVTTAGASYNLIVPGSYNASNPNPLMIVYSGVEGRSQMTQNLLQLRGRTGTSGFIFAVFDGRHASAAHGAAVLDELRAKYNIDNDRTYLLSESAGTRAGLQLGFDLRQSYFAAFWANDVTCSGKPKKKAAELGFKPHGNSGPGGNFSAAKIIVNAMDEAGYRLPKDAPYSGPGCGEHGSPEQFMTALRFFPEKSRK